MSDINNKVELSVVVEDSVTVVNRSDKPQFMLDSEYDMSTLYGTCALMAHFAKLLVTDVQKPDALIDQMARLAKEML